MAERTTLEIIAPTVEEALAQTCPAGIDIYFDNVGGDHLEGALTHMNPFGRIPACGMDLCLQQRGARSWPEQPRADRAAAAARRD